MYKHSCLNFDFLFVQMLVIRSFRFLRLPLCKFVLRRWASSDLRSVQQVSKRKKQLFDYFLILDFEATCDWKVQPQPQEIIEFPCMKMNTETLEVEATFHQYVRPTVHPIISDFCTELTGILQEMVDGQPSLEETLGRFDSWLEEQDLLTPSETTGKWKFAFVTMGEWDLKGILPRQSQFFGIAERPYFGEWINLKKMAYDTTKVWPRGMLHLLEIVNVEHSGRLHSGIDDCATLVQVIKALINKGAVFRITSTRGEE